MEVLNAETFLTRCGDKLNFEANFIPRKSIVRKVNHWEVSGSKRPLSVILIGIDSLSRSSAYRTLPKTLNFLMETMGFTDFKGYHSIAAGTIHNFMGFLTGLSMDEARENCWTDWFEPPDSCPFIWNDFGRQNYVTMYLEDGNQSFNYGGEGGFTDRPTDCYIHSLFKAMWKMRMNISTVRTLNSALYCHLRVT
jgi:hypothetical protein